MGEQALFLLLILLPHLIVIMQSTYVFPPKIMIKVCSGILNYMNMAAT